MASNITRGSNASAVPTWMRPVLPITDEPPPPLSGAPWASTRTRPASWSARAAPQASTAKKARPLPPRAPPVRLRACTTPAARSGAQRSRPASGPRSARQPQSRVRSRDSTALARRMMTSATPQVSRSFLLCALRQRLSCHLPGLDLAPLLMPSCFPCPRLSSPPAPFKTRTRLGAYHHGGGWVDQDGSGEDADQASDAQQLDRRLRRGSGQGCARRSVQCRPRADYPRRGRGLNHPHDHYRDDGHGG